MMPQKRNPFLLEHVQGKSTAALGAFVNSATAMHAKPFTNSISVGTEAVAPVWNALKSVTESLLLTRLVVMGAQPQQSAMLRRAEQGYTSATELANRFVSQQGMAFRNAHYTVGTIIRAAVENNEEPLTQAAARWQNGNAGSISFDGLDPTSVVEVSAYGGGPGRQSLQLCFEALREDWRIHIARVREQASKWRLAAAALNEAVRELK